MVTDTILRSATEEAERFLLTTLPCGNVDQHRFSSRFERKMARLIRRVNHPYGIAGLLIRAQGGNVMKKKLIAVVMICVVCICAVLIGNGIVYAATGESVFYLAGQFFKSFGEQQSEDPGEVLARYNGNAITRSQVDYQRNMNILRGEEAIQENTTDLDIVNNILESIMLSDEAERQGLAATPDEVEALVENARFAYSLPEGKQMLDDFCAGSGITLEEYFEILRQQLPRTIARQKLMDAVGKQYCEENGLEYRKNNPPAAMVSAQKEYIQELFQKNQNKIEYYLDTAS